MDGLPKFPVTWRGKSYDVETKQSDVARLEQQFGMAASKVGDVAELGYVLCLAYFGLRRMGVEVPPTYDLFLDGDPEIDMDRLTVPEVDLGKVSTQEV